MRTRAHLREALLQRRVAQTAGTAAELAEVVASLEAQLLGYVVQKEQPNLETQKAELTMRVAQGKKKLVDLEDEILRLLSETPSLLTLAHARPRPLLRLRAGPCCELHAISRPKVFSFCLES